MATIVSQDRALLMCHHILKANKALTAHSGIQTWLGSPMDISMGQFMAIFHVPC
jgi:hypothetical protein